MCAPVCVCVFPPTPFCSGTVAKGSSPSSADRSGGGSRSKSGDADRDASKVGARAARGVKKVGSSGSGGQSLLVSLSLSLSLVGVGGVLVSRANRQRLASVGPWLVQAF